MADNRQNLVDQAFCPRQVVNDADTVVSNRTGAVVITALTVTRTITLPAANTYPKDLPLRITDETGSLTSSIKININPNGSDTINGLNTLSLFTPKFSLTLVSDNNSKWTIESVGLAAFNNDPNYFYNVTSYSAAQLDAFYAKRDNKIVDPGLRTSQEWYNTSITLPNGGYVYPSDSVFAARVANNGSGGTLGSATVQRIAQATPGGSSYRVRFTVTGTNASPYQDNIVFLGTIIEGFDVASLYLGTAGAHNICFRFGCNSSVAGTFSVSAINSANSRSYIGSITIAANEVGKDVVKSVFFTGDTTGAWLVDNNTGIRISVCLSVGSNYVGSAGWQAGQKFALSNQTNLMATANATFDIFDLGFYDVNGLSTGVVPAFELQANSIDNDKCLRYYETSYKPSILPGSATNDGSNSYYSLAINGSVLAAPTVFYKKQKRTVASVSAYNPINGTGGQYYSYSQGGANGAFALSLNSDKTFSTNNGSNSWGAQESIGFCWVANARMS